MLQPSLPPPPPVLVESVRWGSIYFFDVFLHSWPGEDDLWPRRNRNSYSKQFSSTGSSSNPTSTKLANLPSIGGGGGALPRRPLSRLACIFFGIQRSLSFFSYNPFTIGSSSGGRGNNKTDHFTSIHKQKNCVQINIFLLYFSNLLKGLSTNFSKLRRIFGWRENSRYDT